MYLGTYTPKLLIGNQISLPAKIRKAIGGQQAITTTGYDKCVYGFSPSEWRKMTETELTKPLSSDEGRRLRRQIFAAAEEVKFDSQGRFVLPEFLRSYAGVTEELVVIGAGDHFEIWDSGEWARVYEEAQKYGRS